MGWSIVKVHSITKELMFQSLRGFGVGWSHSRPNRDSILHKVSIPERVWGGLEHRRVELVPARGAFQSLRGFGVGWSWVSAVADHSPQTFQSLRGFGVGWSVPPPGPGVCGLIPSFNP